MIFGSNINLAVIVGIPSTEWKLSQQVTEAKGAICTEASSDRAGGA
jgi:hypothetical protein